MCRVLRARLTCHIVYIWLSVPYLSPGGRVRGLAVCEVKPHIRPKPSPKADFSVGVYSLSLWPKDLSQGSENSVQVSDGSGGYHHYRTLNTAERGLLAHDFKGTSLVYDSPNLFLPTAQRVCAAVSRCAFVEATGWTSVREAIPAGVYHGATSHHATLFTLKG